MCHLMVIHALEANRHRCHSAMQAVGVGMMIHTYLQSTSICLVVAAAPRGSWSRNAEWRQ